MVVSNTDPNIEESQKKYYTLQKVKFISLVHIESKIMRLDHKLHEHK